MAVICDGCVIADAFKNVLKMRIEENFGLYPTRLTISGILKDDTPFPEPMDDFSCVFIPNSCEEGLQGNEVYFTNLKVLGVSNDTETNITTIEAVSEDYFWQTESFQYDQEYDLANGVGIQNFVQSIEEKTGWNISLPQDVSSLRFREIEYEGTLQGAIEYLSRLLGALPHTDYRNKTIKFYTDLDISSGVPSGNIVGKYVTSSGYNGVRVYGKLNHPYIHTSALNDSTFWEQQYRRSDITEFFVPRESWRVLRYYDQGVRTRQAGYIESSDTHLYFWRAMLMRELIAYTAYKQDEIIITSTERQDKSPIVLRFETTGNYQVKGTAKTINLTQTTAGGDLFEQFVNAFNLGQEGVEVAVVYDPEDYFGFVIGVRALVPIAEVPLPPSHSKEEEPSTTVEVPESLEVYLSTAMLNFLSTIKFEIIELNGYRIEFGYGINYGSEPYFGVQNNLISTTQAGVKYAKLIHALQNAKYGYEIELLNAFEPPHHPSENSPNGLTNCFVSRSLGAWKINDCLRNRILLRYA